METQQSYKFLTDLGLAQYDATVRQYMEQTFAKKGETPGGSGVNVVEATVEPGEKEGDWKISEMSHTPDQIWNMLQTKQAVVIQAITPEEGSFIFFPITFEDYTQAAQENAYEVAATVEPGEKEVVIQGTVQEEGTFICFPITFEDYTQAAQENAYEVAAVPQGAQDVPISGPSISKSIQKRMIFGIFLGDMFVIINFKEYSGDKWDSQIKVGEIGNSGVSCFVTTEQQSHPDYTPIYRTFYTRNILTGGTEIHEGDMIYMRRVDSQGVVWFDVYKNDGTGDKDYVQGATCGSFQVTQGVECGNPTPLSVAVKLNEYGQFVSADYYLSSIWDAIQQNRPIFMHVFLDAIREQILFLQLSKIDKNGAWFSTLLDGVYYECKIAEKPAECYFTQDPVIQEMSKDIKDLDARVTALEGGEKPRYDVDLQYDGQTVSATIEITGEEPTKAPSTTWTAQIVECYDFPELVGVELTGAGSDIENTWFTGYDAAGKPIVANIKQYPKYNVAISNKTTGVDSSCIAELINTRQDKTEGWLYDMRTDKCDEYPELVRDGFILKNSKEDKIDEAHCEFTTDKGEELYLSIVIK